jgi:signal peptidase I
MMLKEFCGYDTNRYDLYQEEKKEKRRRIFFRLSFWIISIPIVIILAWFLVTKGIDKTTVINTSMEPTLSKDDSIIINLFSYKIHSPKRFDVCVIQTGDAEHAQYDIKRIYGLPGEEIQIVDSIIYIDGVAIEDEVNAEEMELAGIAATPIKLGSDEYFVLADDRNNSEDSRYSNYGLVHSDEIIGKAWLRTNKFGFINMMNKNN